MVAQGKWAAELAKQVGTSAATSAGTGLGQVVGDYYQRGVDKIFGIDRKAEQLEQQGKLNELQIKGNKELANYGMGLEKQMFDYTFAKQSPEAMKKLYEEAGLNPALLMGGASNVGGTTTGSQSAGQVGGSKASTEAEQIQASVARQGMALQLAKVQSEIDVNKSVAEANRAEANYKSGALTESTNASTSLLINQNESESVKRDGYKLQNDYQRLENLLAEGTLEDNISTIHYLMKQAKTTSEKMLLEKDITEESKESIIQANYLMVVESLSRILLNEKTAKLTDERANAVAEELAIGWLNAVNGTNAITASKENASTHAKAILDSAEITSSTGQENAIIGQVGTILGILTLSAIPQFRGLKFLKKIGKAKDVGFK